MSGNKTYRVDVTRDGDAWLASVPDVDGTHTFARNLRALDTAVREAIALAEDLPRGKAVEDALHLDYHYDIGSPEDSKCAAQVRARRAELDAREKELAAATEAVAVKLVRERSLPVRDVATILGVSPQRVSQLAPQRRGGPLPAH